MERLIQAKIQLKKLLLLVLGLCFVLLYSCPVKKYLLLTFGKARAAQTEACEFQKSHSSHSEKIVYLRRQQTTPVLLVVVTTNLIKDFADYCVAVERAVPVRNFVIAKTLPRYLEVKRFRV